MIEGNYLAWEDMTWNINGTVNVMEIEVADICKVWEKPKVYFTAPFDQWEDCMSFCPKLKGARVPKIESKSEKEDMVNWLRSTFIDPKHNRYYPGALTVAFWMPLSYSDEKEAWIDYYSNNISNSVDSRSVDYSSGALKRCSVFAGGSIGWVDYPCHNSKEGTMGCVCEHQDHMYLELRGLCPESDIDQFYIPRNKPKHGGTIFLGLTNSRIEFIDEDLVWKLTNQKITKDTVAISDSSKGSFVVGSHTWTVYNDKVGCAKKGVPVNRQLKLTGCRSGEFTCENGECIKIEERCDQNVDCRDKSDEKHCRLVHFDVGYDKNIAPFNFDKTTKAVNPVKVTVFMTIENVLENYFLGTR